MLLLKLIFVFIAVFLVNDSLASRIPFRQPFATKCCPKGSINKKVSINGKIVPDCVEIQSNDKDLLNQTIKIIEDYKYDIKEVGEVNFYSRFYVVIGLPCVNKEKVQFSYHLKTERSKAGMKKLKIF
ncbi:hypothetical protein O0L34_g6249 [Tuta absoluta]|nr:hypothetical protein O0L34_g6249 [Tuta absoluta]